MIRDKSQEGEETRREKELTRESKGTKDPIRRKGKTPKQGVLEGTVGPRMGVKESKDKKRRDKKSIERSMCR